MPRIAIELLEGRTVETKRELAKEITKVVCDVCKVPAEAVSISIDDVPRTNLAKGGVLFSDMDNK